MFQEDHRVARAEGVFQQSLGIVGRRRDDHAQAREMSVHRIIIARVMRGRRMADADAAAQQDGHLEPAAAHVLNLGDLIDDLAHGIEHEIGEHEVDDRPGAGHGRAATQADESALADRRVAQPRRAHTARKARRSS